MKIQKPKKSYKNRDSLPSCWNLVLKLSQKWYYWAGPVNDFLKNPQFSFPANQMVTCFPRGKPAGKTFSYPYHLNFHLSYYILVFPATSCFPSYQTSPSFSSFSPPLPPYLPFFPSLPLLLPFPLSSSSTHLTFPCEAGRFWPVSEYSREASRTQTTEITSYSTAHHMSGSTKNWPYAALAKPFPKTQAPNTNQADEGNTLLRALVLRDEIRVEVLSCTGTWRVSSFIFNM